MTTAQFTEEQVMLTLACCSYFGFDLPPGSDKGRTLRELTADKLATLAPVKEGWELVWGPASFRAPLTLFDDSAMFVARDRRRPSRYVVSIRGTNPLSLFDWVFGDFHVGRQLDWSYGDPVMAGDARISYSTALGLNILQHLRATPPDGGAGRDGVKGIAKRLFEHHSDALRDRLKQLSTQLNDTLKEGLGTRLQHVSKHSFDERVRVLAASWESGELSRLFKHFEDAAGLVERGRFDLLRFLEGGARLRSRFDSGEDLLSFLSRTIEDAENDLEIVVTGHSKGGALSATAALWLADTQGGSEWVPEDERWDPERKATVSCYSFAGPTAGNAAFAAHSDAVIGDRCHRVANPLDVVTNAWQVEDLRGIPTLYWPLIDPPPGMVRLAELIAAETQELGYTQIGNQVRLLRPALNAKKTRYPDQLVYQHLQAYINELGLGDHMSQKTFFKL